MNILYFASIDFYSKPNPSFHLMTTMIDDILKEGHKIYFIGCAEEGVDKHIPQNLEKDSKFVFQLIHVPKVKKSSFIKRYFYGISYAFKTIKFLKKFIPEVDLIFVQSSPTVLYNLYFAKKYSKKAKIIYNVQDMFPGSSIASGVMPYKWMQSIFYMLQKIAYKKADIITAISEDMKQKLIDQNVPDEKVRVIVNWFDDQSVHYVKWEENRFVKKYNMDKNKFYIQYAGTMGYVFDYLMVIEVAKKLKEYEDIEIQMIGAGSQKEVFISKAFECGLDNIKFLPLEPQEMVSDVYSACDLCFIPLKKGIIGNSVPSKAGLLMECKKAIVTTVDENSDYSFMINKNKIGYAVSTPEEAVESILYLYKNREECIKCGERGYEYGHNLYSRKNNMDRYLKLFSEIIGEK